MNDCAFLAQEMVSANPFPMENCNKQESWYSRYSRYKRPCTTLRSWGLVTSVPSIRGRGGGRGEPLLLQNRTSKIEARRKEARKGWETKIEIDFYLLHTTHI